MIARDRGLKAVNDDPATQDEGSAYRAIWAAVLARALNDAAGYGDGTSGSRYGLTSKIVQSDAQSWIGSRDFEDVCDMAGLDASSVEAAYRAGKFSPGTYRVGGAHHERSNA